MVVDTADQVMEQIFDDDHEFWRRDTETTFRDSARVLLQYGMNVYEAADFLGALYSAVSSEYGN